MSKPQQPKAFDPEVSFYSPKDEAPRVTAIKQAAIILTNEVLEQVPEGADRTLALRAIEDGVLRAEWAIKRVAAAEAVEQERAAEERKKRNAA